jgi:hypothetical protein
LIEISNAYKYFQNVKIENGWAEKGAVQTLVKLDCDCTYSVLFREL